MNTINIEEQLKQLELIKSKIKFLNEIRLNDESIYKWEIWKDKKDVPKDPYKVLFIYYNEILEKMNMAAVTLLNRTVEWAKGFFDSMEKNSWLSSAAALRGAMESAGDAIYSMRSYFNFLIEEKTYLEQWVKNDQTKITEIHDYKEIEDSLNDYLFANSIQNNKLRQETYLPQAKPNKTYIETIGAIDGDNGKNKYYNEYYAQLCELTHPTGIPLRQMYIEQNNEIKFNKEYIKYGIENLEKQAAEMAQRIFITPINYSLCIMRLLAVMNANPQNKIHKNLDLSEIFSKNDILKKAIDVFGKENIELAGKI